MTVNDILAGRYHRAVADIAIDAYDFGVYAARRGFKKAWVEAQVPTIHGWREAALRGYADASRHAVAASSCTD